MATTGGRSADAVKGGDRPPQGVLVDGPENCQSSDGVRPAVVPQWPRESVAARLLSEGYGFDFFQAVRLFEKMDPSKVAVGRGGPPQAEPVRFRAHLSLSFPPSQIYQIEPPTPPFPISVMTVAFMGITGPSGVLPRHYTELLMRMERDSKAPDRRAMRDWFDLFNHRFISLFYRSWEKYRFYLAYERGDHKKAEPDTFTRALFSLVGLGLPSLRNRLRISSWEEIDRQPQERVLGKVEDLAILYYGGLFAHRPRSAVGLEAVLTDYFGVPIHVRQFQGQWLRVEPTNQTRLGILDGNCQLGTSAFAGASVFDVQGKVRIRIGPVNYAQFGDFLPEREPVPHAKTIFLLLHLTRLYVGPALDFDVQLLLDAEDVPECQLDAYTTPGPRLGWNTWLRSQIAPRHAEDAVFEGNEIVFVNRNESVERTGTGGDSPPRLHSGFGRI